MARTVARVFVASIVTSVVCGTTSAQQLQWTQSPINGHWYGVEYATKSWTQGEAEAVSLGGHLATVRSQIEQTWFSGALGGLVPSNGEGFWIGANDAQVEGQFVWSSGEPIVFTNWYPGEPNNLSDEDYVQVGTDFGWNDRDASEALDPRPLVEVVQRPDTGWSWPQFYATGTHPRSHAVADVNADGLLDLVVPARTSNTVSVLRNRGSGQFTSSLTLLTAAGPTAVEVADVDHDTHADLVVACYDASVIQIHQGTGGGGFIDGATINIGAHPHGLVVGDFDGNGWIDVAVTTVDSTDQLLVYRNNGAGGFLAPDVYFTQARPVFVSAADLSSDGKLDLVVSNQNSDSIGVYTNLGTGVFTVPTFFASGPQPHKSVVADMNGDGLMDIVVPNYSASGVTVLTENAQGGFAAGTLMPTSGWPIGVDVADIDRDGYLDIAVAQRNSTDVALFMATGSGEFGPATYLVGANNQFAIRLIDVDGDGMPDISVSGESSNDVAVILSNYTCSAITSYCTASTTTNGCTPTIAGTGGPSASQPTGFNITVTGVEGQKNGLIFYGRSPTAVAWAIGSYSYVCVAPPVQRTAITNSGGTLGGCDGVLTIDFNSFMAANPTAYGNPFMAGEVFYAQGWFRDPGAVKGTNLSDGLRFTLCN